MMNKIKEKFKEKQLLTLLWKFLIFIYLQWTLQRNVIWFYHL